MKVNKFLLTYNEALGDFSVDYDKIKTPYKAIKRFVKLLDEEVNDARLQGMIEYPLNEILLLAFLAILSGASSWADLERFGNSKLKFLRKFLPFKNGTPSHDTFRRVFSLIDPKELEKATVVFVMDFFEKVKKTLKLKFEGKDQIIVDGKEACSSGRNYGTEDEIRNLQTLHVYDATNEICLASEIINQKTNEIPVARDLLSKTDLKGKIVSFDALHTQKETVKVIVSKGGDFVGGLKGNQSELYNTSQELFTDENLNKIQKTKNYFKFEIEKNHRQIELREMYRVDTSNVYIDEEWVNINSIICYVKKITDYKKNKSTIEKRYYISSIKDITLVADAIRNHWSIENKLHWHLDMTFGEDNNSTMDKNAFANFSLMNKMCLSLLKLIQPRYKVGLNCIKKSFGWELQGMISELLCYYSKSEIQNALIYKK